jgi:hypothetical protein
LSDAPQSTDRDPIELLAEEFVERQRCGECPSLTEYTSKYPELADEIRDLFPALVMIERLKPAIDDPSRPALDERINSLALDKPSISRLDDFRILREVGRGGMGVVYEAVQESMGRHVALKILSLSRRLGPTQIARFKLEARSAGRLQHANIVPVYGVGEHQGMHYYAMQFIEGHGLDAILDDLRRIRSEANATPATSPGTLGASAWALELGSLARAHSVLTGKFEIDKNATDSRAALATARALTPTVSEADALTAPPWPSRLRRCL